MLIDDIKFDEKGLVPAIVQDYKTGEVLMQAYMNRESLIKTLETGRSWFYSRSRKELWEKGATSGSIQLVKEIFYDCDGDSLLLKVEQAGAACHTGNRSCFYRSLRKAEGSEGAVNIGEIVERLYDIVGDRRKNPVEGSYTCYLFNKGIDKICKKIGEEGTEVVIAAKNRSKEEAVYEISDLIYHLTVLMNYMGVTYEDIGIELMKRSR
ncbi:MAG TPA: bifunctional phosphoribosyl-AMP cyclohydrolase/phosphoribosyl-ATP diphosphatase HisIE [Bacillota bacterium]|jgi:phosphoribosyl-ATP pyrophosphohydrolase/phosphoribosyl-AMP cyclohydrolase|nr:bifunctional phosphoribosyl-AMP cyclohydrolase/phosphoribosyl-ATP diphosphatase HisIE [Bacillota bacterium]